MFGDFFDCHNGGGRMGFCDIWWVETRDAAQHSKYTGQLPQQRANLSKNVNSAEVE